MRSTNDTLPKISYIKGIDVFIVFCFIQTFFSVIEYGVVSYLHRYNERSKRKFEKIKQLKTLIPATNG